MTAGSPDDTELAVVCAVLSAATTVAPPAAPPRRSAWSDPAARLGVTHGWRSSALPGRAGSAVIL
ncbi:acyl-CoA carboxylase epsilon subunit [Stackebrandtia albiflava]|uniref:acyl-CoA carboxylase epsilon subunit n=1 Tax=Stackebrandtia albiflava TaxID=406432 RepID=UPI0031E77F3F